MKKHWKILTIILIIIIGLGSIGLIIVMYMWPSQEPQGPEANTYAENSSINFLEYAVKFSSGDIVIEDFFNITSGRLNGYTIINSTDCVNCSINHETRFISISLHNDVKMTLKNINCSEFSIYLHDDSYLTVENCTFEELWLFDLSSAIVKNSTINFVRVSPPFEVPGVYYYQTSLSIIENSTINSIGIREGCNLFIKDSKLLGTWSIFISTVSPLTIVTGNIENSTLQRVRVEGYANLKFYGSSLERLYVYDMARVTLDQSVITNNFGCGIIAYSGTTNINKGIVTGSGYINNTILINSITPTPLLMSVAANNSANVIMTNFSCSVYLHDDSIATIANLTDSSLMSTLFSTFYGTLMDSSFLTLENNDFSPGYLTCIDNSKLVLKNTSLSDLYSDTTNSITIDNCSIGDVQTHFFYSNLARDNIYIANSTLFDLSVGGKDIVYVEDSTISRLYEGVIVYSGSLILNSGGFSGTGNYKNFTTLVNTNILISRELRIIEVNATAKLTLQDYFSQCDIICTDNSELICENSNIDNLIARDSAKITVDNSSIYEQVLLFDSSTLEATQIGYIDGLMTMGNSVVSIINATMYLIYVYESSRVSVQNLDVTSINVLGSNTIDYALKALNSTTILLSTFTW
ncbi:MAG: hypothetical protein ACFE9I_13990 [Candidatus Hermodarchaeota archaeon]